MPGFAVLKFSHAVLPFSAWSSWSEAERYLAVPAGGGGPGPGPAPAACLPGFMFCQALRTFAFASASSLAARAKGGGRGKLVNRLAPADDGVEVKVGLRGVVSGGFVRRGGGGKLVLAV